MKQDWRAFLNLIGIISLSILLSNKLRLTPKTASKITIAGLLLVAGISGCESSTNAQSPQHKWTGEWQLKNPDSSDSSQNMKIILTSKGKAYFISPYSATKEKVAYEIPLEKVS